MLQFDDVMNKQREIIYGQRRKVLNGEDLSATVRTMMDENIAASVESFCAGENPADWDLAALRRHYQGWLTRPTDFVYPEAELKGLSRDKVAQVLQERGAAILDAKEKQYGSPVMRELERVCLLRNVDTKWMEHIDNMDQLRQGIYLRSYGQRDPVVEYRLEGFEMFDEMIAAIRENTARMMLTVQIRRQEEPKREEVAKPTATSADGTDNKRPVRNSGKKPGRNDPCPCGSGLKYKKCCGKNE